MNPALTPSSTALQAASPRYRWAVVGMLWFICFFNYADRQAIFSIFPLLEKHFGFDKAQLGVIGMAFTWVYALSAPLAGQVGDRFARKFVIISGLWVWSIITGFTALCSKVWHFVLVRGAEGLGETFYFPASMSLISDYHTGRTRSRAMSIHQTSVYAGTMAGGALAGWLGQEYGWKYPFLILGGAGLALGMVLSVFIREPGRNEAERIEAAQKPLESVFAISPKVAEGAPVLEYASTARANPGTEPAHVPLTQFLIEWINTPTAMILLGAFFGANFVAVVFLTWMPTFLKEKFGLTLAAAGIGATFFIQFASMGGSVLGGVLADRRVRRSPGGRTLIQAIGLLAGAPFVFLCGYTRDKSMLMLAMTLFGLCKGLYDANLWASLYDVIPPSRRGTAVGLMNLVGWFGGGLGSLAVGVVVSKGVSMSTAIASNAIIYLVVAIMLFVASFVFAPRDVRR